MSMWKLALLLGVIASISIGLFFVRDQHPPLKSAYQTEVDIWKGRFQMFGDTAAYAQYIREAGNLPYDQAHALSHIIGEILYSRQGEKGITECTSDFGFGCYHGFAGVELSAKGLSASRELDAACLKSSNYLGCTHGIGHGILAYVGDSKLEQALAACPPADTGNELGGCYGGVFMEYNYHTMQSTNGFDPRPYDSENPYAPCVEVPSKFEAACYYELPSWWRISLDEKGMEVNSQYKTLGDRCESASDTYRTVCFRGIGNMIGPESGYKASVMKEWCNRMPADGKEVCLHEALGHLLQSEAGKIQLESVCSSGVVRDDYCLQSSR